jgi:hypothetical protein
MSEVGHMYYDNPLTQALIRNEIQKENVGHTTN